MNKSNNSINSKKIGGLRNLSRAIQFMNAAIEMGYPVIKAVYDGLVACFASHLEKEMQQQVIQLIT